MPVTLLTDGDKPVFQIDTGWPTTERDAIDIILYVLDLPTWTAAEYASRLTAEERAHWLLHMTEKPEPPYEHTCVEKGCGVYSFVREQAGKTAELRDVLAAMDDVTELPVPDGFRGYEILRLFLRAEDGDLITVSRPTAVDPGEWGVALHDVAKNVVRAAVASGACEENEREAMLNVIFRAFRDEHKKPTDDSRPYERKLDS
jgi:hypothetical protein